MALEFADTLCLEKPISNIDARNAREFTDFDEELLRKLSPQRRAEALVVPVIRDATFKIVCPVTKHLPEHPRRDLLAGFPLPRGTVLDDDPVLDRADDDPAFTDEDDPKFRSATYLPPQSMSFDDLKPLRDVAGACRRGVG